MNDNFNQCTGKSSTGFFSSTFPLQCDARNGYDLLQIRPIVTDNDKQISSRLLQLEQCVLDLKNANGILGKRLEIANSNIEALIAKSNANENLVKQLQAAISKIESLAAKPNVTPIVEPEVTLLPRPVDTIKKLESFERNLKRSIKKPNLKLKEYFSLMVCTKSNNLNIFNF